MKCTVFILLGYLVFVTAYTHPYDKVAFHSSVSDKVSQTIEDFIKSTLTPFSAAFEKVKDILTKTYIRISETIQKSMGSLTSILNHLNVTAENVKKISEKAKVCVEHRENELNSTQSNVQNELQLCAEDFIKQIQNQQNIIQKDFNNIDQNIEEFRLSVVTCIHFNPITTTKCVFNRINDYRQIIGKIGSNFKKTVEDATVNAAKIPKGLVLCNQDVIKNAVLKFDEILKNIKKCADL